MINSNLSGKASSSHNHDSRYYTESEIDTKVTSLNNGIKALDNILKWGENKFTISTAYAENGDYSYGYKMGNVVIVNLGFGLKVAIPAFSTIQIGTTSVISRMDSFTIFITNKGKAGTVSIRNRSNNSAEGLKVYLETYEVGIEKGDWVRAYLIYFTN